MTDEQWYAILDCHLTAPFRILRAAQPVIRGADQGRRPTQGREVFRKVVNISSIAGLGGNAGQANYAAAKAGIIGMTKALAKEWGRMKVNVNTVAFGFIRTRLTEVTADADAHGQHRRAGTSRSASIRTWPRRWTPRFRWAAAAHRKKPRARSTCSAFPSRTTSPVRRWCAAAASAWPDTRREHGRLAMLENYKPAWTTEEHDMLADTARRFATEEIIPNDARWREQHCVDKAAWNKAGETRSACCPTFRRPMAAWAATSATRR